MVTLSGRANQQSAIVAAEQAASGESMSDEEDRATYDEAVLQACELERRKGDEAAARALCKERNDRGRDPHIHLVRLWTSEPLDNPRKSMRKDQA